MTTIRVYPLLSKRVLVTRESARVIGTVLGAAIAESQGEVSLDFSGVDGVTPSFLDETLAAIEQFFSGMDGEKLRLTVVNPPTRLSLKFVAVGRGRGLSITELENRNWLIMRGEHVSPNP